MDVRVLWQAAELQSGNLTNVEPPGHAVEMNDGVMGNRRIGDRGR